jgi:hypothetical protein
VNVPASHINEAQSVVAAHGAPGLPDIQKPEEVSQKCIPQSAATVQGVRASRQYPIAQFSEEHSAEEAHISPFALGAAMHRLEPPAPLSQLFDTQS